MAWIDISNLESKAPFFNGAVWVKVLKLKSRMHNKLFGEDKLIKAVNSIKNKMAKMREQAQNTQSGQSVQGSPPPVPKQSPLVVNVESKSPATNTKPIPPTPPTSQPPPQNVDLIFGDHDTGISNGGSPKRPSNPAEGMDLF